MDARSMVNGSHFLRDVINSTICLYSFRADFKCLLFFIVTPVISLYLPHLISLVSSANSLARLAQVETLSLFSWCDNIEASFEPVFLIFEHFVGSLYLSFTFNAFQFLFVAYWFRLLRAIRDELFLRCNGRFVLFIVLNWLIWCLISGESWRVDFISNDHLTFILFIMNVTFRAVIFLSHRCDFVKADLSGLIFCLILFHIRVFCLIFLTFKL